MPGRIRLFVLGVAFALLAACRGSDGKSSNVVSAQDGGTVTSPDGLVKLVFPPGAVDDDTEIKIERADASGLPAEIRELSLVDQIYQLEPEGIEFNIPVEATITLEGIEVPTDEASSIASVEYFTWDESHGFEPLGDEAVTGEITQAMILAEEGTVSVRGTLRHFSRLTGVEGGIRYAFLPPVPSPQPTGGTFEASLVLSNATPANSGVTHRVTFVEPRGIPPVDRASDPLRPDAILEPGGLVGYVSEPLRYRCGTFPGDGRYDVLWTSMVSLPPDAKPTVIETKWGTDVVSYQGLGLLRDNASGGLEARGIAYKEMTCGSPGQDESSSSSGDWGSSSSETSETESSGDTDGDGCTTEEAAGVLDQFVGSEFVGSVLGDLQSSIGTVDSGDTTKTCKQCGKFIHKDDHTHTCGVTGHRAPTDQGVESTRWTAEHLAADRSPSAALPCGMDGDTLTLCPVAAEPMPPGDYVVVTHVVRGDVPQSDPSKHYQYGFVFDADGDSTNNYIPPDQFENDFFRDTDLWFVASYDPATGWELQITDATDGNPVSVAINARIAIRGNTLVLIAPPDAFTVSDPAYRVTAFEHDGTWVDDPVAAGDTEPPIELGLRPFDGSL